MKLNGLGKEDQKKVIAAAYRRLERMKKDECFDPIDLNSRPVPAQQAVLDGINDYKHRYIRAGNQVGKSSLGARETAWLFQDNHPTWTRPKDWKDEPLLMIVVGRTSKQVEEVLWRKIKGLLNPGEYSEQRSGGALQKITHKTNGNTIIFASHHSENEAREKLQAFVAHYVWIDEMPGSVQLLEELHRRVQARNGYFLATFTPKVKNDSIRKFVDSQEQNPIANVFILQMFDNPLYSGREEEVLAQMAGLNESYKNSILYGDWLKDDLLVYDFERKTMVVESLPSSYSPAWRHVEAVDPALQSKLGFILLAEDPATSYWYVVKAEYVKGIYVPEDLVRSILKKTEGYNITRRTSDVAPWYVNTANATKVRPSYMTVQEKTTRKGELIKNLQTALGQKLFIASWCVDLIEELSTCAFSETVQDKIVGAQRYHLLDALQYGVDILPAPTQKLRAPNRDAFLREQYEKRLNEQAQEEKKRPKNPNRKSFKIARRRW